MVTAMFVLLGVAALIALSIGRPSSSFPISRPTDRDRDRTLADLRALPGYHSDVRLR